MLVSRSVLTGNERYTVYGFWVVIGSLVVFLSLVLLTRSGHRKIGIYRPYEERLLKLNRLDLKDIFNYHAQYNWSNYSGIAIGIVLLSITLMIINDREMTSVELTIQSIIVGFMDLAVVLLVFGEMVHTNTQTPIVPIKTRFRLIDISIQFGTLGVIFLVFAVLLFTCMISFTIVIFACVVCIGALCYTGLRRRIPKDEFFQFFDIIDHEAWLMGGEGLTPGDRKNRMFSEDHLYIKNWPLGSGKKTVRKRKTLERGAISIEVEEWMQNMITTGLLEKERADALWQQIPSIFTSADQENERQKRVLINAFVSRLKPYCDVDNQEDKQHLSNLVDSVATYFQWSHDNRMHVRNELGLAQEQ